MAEPAADDEIEHGATCRLQVTTATSDESLARVVGVLRRTRWSVRELHYRSGADRHELHIAATKRQGRPDLLVAQLRREVLVIDVEARPSGVLAGQGSSTGELSASA